MTANFDYYQLAHVDEGVGAGFHCRTVANCFPRELWATTSHRMRRSSTTSPSLIGAWRGSLDRFTVEAVPAPAVKPLDEIGEPEVEVADISVARSGPTARQGDWRDELLKAGIRGKAGQNISFSRLEPLPATRWLQAEGETKPEQSDAGDIEEPGAGFGRERVAVSFGPDHFPLEQRQVALAIEEAHTLVPMPKIIVFAAFQFDPEASKDIDETRWPGVTLLKAQMNADLLTDDLKKKRASNESFWLIGQPDVEVECIAAGDYKGRFRISVQGVRLLQYENW